MTARRAAVALGVAATLGLIVLNLGWLLEMAGTPLTLPHGDAVIAPEYWIGLLFVPLLGALFPRHALACAVTFMWVPVVLRHGAYIAQGGLASLWPVELAGIVALTLPYIAAAYAGAYLRLRLPGNVM